MIVTGWVLLDDSIGQSLMIWSVRGAVVCYLLRVVVLLRRSGSSRVPSAGECLFWGLGCLLYIVHVILAFDHVHHWSHRLALEHTADVTQQVTGLARGEGIWVNYVFTAIWMVDVVRIAVARKRGRETLRALDITIQCFFAFIVFNATVVFGPAVYRWLLLPAGLLVGWAWQSRKR